VRKGEKRGLCAGGRAGGRAGGWAGSGDPPCSSIQRCEPCIHSPITFVAASACRAIDSSKTAVGSNTSGSSARRRGADGATQGEAGIWIQFWQLPLGHGARRPARSCEKPARAAVPRAGASVQHPAAPGHSSTRQCGCRPRRRAGATAARPTARRMRKFPPRGTQSWSAVEEWAWHPLLPRQCSAHRSATQSALCMASSQTGQCPPGRSIADCCVDPHSLSSGSACSSAAAASSRAASWLKLKATVFPHHSHLVVSCLSSL
jgi:hypothetical protein